MEQMVLPLMDNDADIILMNMKQYYKQRIDESSSIKQSIQCALYDWLFESSDINDILEQFVQTMRPGIINEETTKDAFQYLYGNPLFIQTEWQYTKKGVNHPFCVIDLKTRKERPCNIGGHFETMLAIIEADYIDYFNALSTKEKDQFVMNNFLLIGSRNKQDMYVHKIINNYLTDETTKKQY